MQTVDFGLERDSVTGAKGLGSGTMQGPESSATQAAVKAVLANTYPAYSPFADAGILATLRDSVSLATY